MLAATAAADDRAIDAATRQCVAAAANATALADCERRAQRDWEERLRAHRAALAARLEGEALAAFEAAQSAWEDYRRREFALIERSFAARGDGLAAPLAAGARTMLLRQRAEQLATHLSNLGPASGR